MFKSRKFLYFSTELVFDMLSCVKTNTHFIIASFLNLEVSMCMSNMVRWADLLARNVKKNKADTLNVRLL